MKISQPLQLILRRLLISNQMLHRKQQEVASDLRIAADMMKYAAIVTSTAPIMLYPFVQKYFNQGVMIGGLERIGRRS